MRSFLLAINFASNQATSDLRSKNPSCPSPGGEFYNRDFQKWIYFPTKSLSGYAFSSRADWNQVLVGRRVFCCSCVRTMPDWSVFEKYFSSKLGILLAFHPSPNTLHHKQYSGLPNLFKFFFIRSYINHILWIPSKIWKVEAEWKF